MQLIAHTAGSRRRFQAPFVGRERQRAVIDTILREVVSHRDLTGIVSIAIVLGLGWLVWLLFRV